MGASAWDHVVPYQPDPGAALDDLQDEVLASGDFLWNEKYFRAPRPATRADLAAVKEGSEFWTEGTHTVLDVDRVVPALPENIAEMMGAVCPLSPDQVHDCFGSRQPTEADFRLVCDDFDWTEIGIKRWTGRYIVLYDGQKEQQIAFFGFSGD
jgi:hypothetical protein